MANDNLILATTSNGKNITVKDCMNHLVKKDKVQLAYFVYDGLYARYLKPFSFPDKEYVRSYKNGFSIMSACCLLIETYASFTDKRFRRTHMLSGKTFGHFFTTQSSFSELSEGGLNPDGTIADRKDGGLPNDFYENVRCGILHNAEIKNGWTITREVNTPYFDPVTKTLNATKFANRLTAVLTDYRDQLIKSDFDCDDIWINFKNRLGDLINQS